MALDQGLGDVENKNEIIFQDTFAGYLTAVRHGNGRDWWVAAHKGRSNRSLFFLLDPAGVQPPKAQHIGPVWGPRDWSGQSVFSPDGSRYARANPDHGLNLFKFDRCTGTLSSPVVVSLAADSAGATGVTFSPNSRFLYLSTGTKLFQFDMQAANIPASKQLIGVYDGFAAPFATTFYQMRLAPNGKIYMGATNGVNYLHVVNQPDMPGAACEFVQHEVELPTYIDVGLPNFPNFRLYDLPASPCDTLGINGGPWWTSTGEAPDSQVSVWPNSFHDHLTVALNANLRSPALRLFDAAGRLVLEQRLVPGVNEIETVALPQGLYVWEVIAGKERVKAGKIAKHER
ncbi:MAG: T9SS type A sorting domain-containing protein [Saprospiraceae bacterium]